MFYGVNRPYRRLLPCTYSPGISEVPKVCDSVRSKNRTFPIQSPPFWYCHCTKGFYKNYFRNVSLHQTRSGAFHTLPRRFSSGGAFRRSSRRTSNQSSENSRFSGMASQHRKIRNSPVPTEALSGGSPRLKLPKDLSPPGKTGKNKRKYNKYKKVLTYNHQERYVPARESSGHHSRSSLGSISHKNLTVFSSSSLGQKSFFLRQRDTYTRVSKGISKLVVESYKFRERSPLGFKSRKNHYNRRKPMGLGCTLGRQNISGPVEHPGSNPLIKRQRITSHFKGAGSSSTFPEGQKHCSKIRQYLGSSLYKQARGYKGSTPHADSLSDFSAGRVTPSVTEGSIHKRGRKYPSRLLKPQHHPSGRMGSQWENLQPDNQKVGGPRNRPFCQQRKSKGKTFFLHKLQGSSISNRCLLPKLGRPSPVIRFSPHDPDSQNSGEDKAGKGKSHPHRPLLASPCLVFKSERHVNSGPMGSARMERLVIPGPYLSSGSEGASSYGMAIERLILEKKGLSGQVISTLQKSRKPITYRIYLRTWKAFFRFMGQRPIDMYNPDFSNILGFLQLGLEKGLKPSTLKVQVSALAALFDQDVANHPWVARFIKASIRLCPTTRSSFPPWDLSLVLKALSGPPFEPLENLSLKLLTFKVVFLVAITSARRVSEIAALSRRPPYFTLFPDKIVLRPDPKFLPKVVSDFHRSQDIVLPSFCSEPKSDKEKSFHNLDVRRSVLQYLESSELFRRTDSLFVLFSGKNKGTNASSTTIARWIRATIQLAYEVAERSIPENIHAHSTRALATSWAEFRHASLEQICQAACWSTPHTFFKHYRLDVAGSLDLSFGRKVLSSIIPP
ncbi:hypothetical protein GDO81_017103 [Engystomops pustulosus]|uniref:Tyr recombinase domain-containing protein n=1 Tax=Engystomops pustulosus TaxID=76066 RepID=A0AAV7ABK4_ENGPU|nr:hypothetical protein GDO81_017103 [Engystomops pustulosus]KAG8558683.1 hypothetical protein GDO81_017103 [Engystomops pustulosus]